jgi:tRNA G26 N,N-dimethylase Trm1
MNERARTRGASEVHAAEETAAQESTRECTEVHAAEVHAPGPLFRGGGHQEEWEKRLRAAVEKTLQERARKKTERQQFALRRMHGLAARHAAKLARKKENEA